jgi:hypothetical protein
LVIENIETNAEVDDKPPSNNKVKGAEAKGKMESIDSLIPKKACKGLVHWTKKNCSLCKKHGDTHATHNTRDCNQYSPMGHTRSPVAWLSLTRKTSTKIVQTSCRLFVQNARKLSLLPSKRMHELRNTAIIMTKRTVTPIQSSDVLGWIAQGNYVFDLSRLEVEIFT